MKKAKPKPGNEQIRSEESRETAFQHEFIFITSDNTKANLLLQTTKQQYLIIKCNKC